MISPDEIGGGAGGGFSSIGETNDGSTTVGQLSPASASGFGPESGIGPIAMDSETGAFFLDHDGRGNRVELAYVVYPDDSSASVDLFLEVLGGGDVSAAFGFHGNEPVHIFDGVPEPGGAALATAASLALGLNRRKPDYRRSCRRQRTANAL